MEYNKTCPNCGQSMIPFKMGVCVCGEQVGKIQFIINTKRYAKNYYSYNWKVFWDIKINDLKNIVVVSNRSYFHDWFKLKCFNHQ